MMSQREEEEKKNRRRGLLIAFFIHLAILILALIPFMRYGLPDEVRLQDAVEVLVIDFSKSREGASARAKSEPRQETARQTPAPATAEIFKIEPLPVPEVITTRAPEKIKLPEASMPPVTREIPEARSPTPSNSEVVEAQTSTSETATTSTPSGDNQQGSSQTAGNTDAIEGEGKGSRYDGLDLSGNGVLTRRLLSRANLDGLIAQDGTFVINICVNQRGRVVAAKYNEEASTIKDMQLVRKAIDAAMNYKFEQDYSAAPKECGRLTISIKGTSRGNG